MRAFAGGFSLDAAGRPRRSAQVLPSAVLAGIFVAASAAVGGGVARAEAGSSAAATTPHQDRADFDIDYEKHTLANGLQLILHRDPSLPLVAVNLWYHVGPANEPAGRSGFAHLFEHLMFEGSKHAGSSFDRLLESVGATRVNGTTSWDRTNYYETVPRQHLELALWLESDRMGFMLEALTEEGLRVQRGVVENERRQRYENSPYGPSDLTLYDLLFPVGHPYHGAVIGSMQDLARASMQDVRDFYRSHYSPSNATLTLAGDFDPEQARGLVERYFGALPGAPLARAPVKTTSPLDAERRRTVREAVRLARVSMGWLTPPAFTDEDIALDVATTILAGGKASRLYQALVVKEKLASDVSSYVDSNALTSITLVEATGASTVGTGPLEAAIDRVLAALGREGPTDRELARAKRQLELRLALGVQSLDGHGGEGGRAGLLQRFNHYLGDPGYLPTYVERLRAVDADRVSKAVRELLTPTARAIVATEPTERPLRAEEGQ